MKPIKRKRKNHRIHPSVHLSICWLFIKVRFFDGLTTTRKKTEERQRRNKQRKKRGENERQRSNTKREGMKQKKNREAVQRGRVWNKRKTEKQYKERRFLFVFDGDLETLPAPIFKRRLLNRKTLKTTSNKNNLIQSFWQK